MITPAEEAMAPFPAATLRTLTDLGLSDAEIARYFNLETREIMAFRLALDRRNGPVSHRMRGMTGSARNPFRRLPLQNIEGEGNDGPPPSLTD
jgi:hypothetical protein